MGRSRSPASIGGGGVRPRAAICRSLERISLNFLGLGFFFASQLRWEGPFGVTKISERQIVLHFSLRTRRREVSAPGRRAQLICAPTDVSTSIKCKGFPRVPCAVDNGLRRF
jgi:hypothetical protein